MGQKLRPIVEGAQSLVVAAFPVAVVDGQVGEVHQIREAPCVRCRVVGSDPLLGDLQRGLGVHARGGPLRSGQVEIGRGLDEPVSLGHGEGREHDALRVLRVVVQAVLGALLATRVLGVVPGPLPEREDGLPGLLHGLRLGVSQAAARDLLPELDGLGEDDLLLGGEERHLGDLLEVHADRVVDADEVRSRGLRLVSGGRRCRGFVIELDGGIAPGLLPALLDGDPDAESDRPSRPEGHRPRHPAAARRGRHRPRVGRRAPGPMRRAARRWRP